MIMAQIGASWCTLSIVIHGSGAVDVDEEWRKWNLLHYLILAFCCMSPEFVSGNHDIHNKCNKQFMSGPRHGGGDMASGQSGHQGGIPQLGRDC